MKLAMFCGLLLLVQSVEAATVDGLKIHSTITGTGRTTVFLVHGYTCDDTTWSEQVPALSKQFRVVTLDLPGHGKSDTPTVEHGSCSSATAWARRRSSSMRTGFLPIPLRWFSWTA